MASSKNDSSWFDDNFEVTYDDDSTLRPSIDFDTTKLENTSQKNTKKTKRKKKGNTSSKNNNKSVDLSIPTNISREEEKAQARQKAIQKAQDEAYAKMKQGKSKPKAKQPEANIPNLFNF